MSEFFSGRSVLVTGGLGFIGSALVHRLLALGARVRVVDNQAPGMGANLENLAGVWDRIEWIDGDIGNIQVLEKCLPGVEVVFNCAGQVSHSDSMSDPLQDLRINSHDQLVLLDYCKKASLRPRIVFASTRQIYGLTDPSKPTDETAPLFPLDINGINKLSGELFHRLYSQVHGIETVSLRLTNCFGPRQLIKHNRQGFIAWFMNRALLSEKIQIFGDGLQFRDFTFVSDVVEAFLLAGSAKKTSPVYNLGGIRKYSLGEVAQIFKTLNPRVKIEIVPFPAERKKIDIGNYVADWSLIHRELGWQPRIDLAEGLSESYRYYTDRLDKYLD